MNVHELSSKYFADEKRQMKKPSLRAVIPILSMMSANIFFSTAALFGYDYLGIESSYIYALYIATVALACVLSQFLLIFRRRTFTIHDIIVFLIALSFLVLYLSTGFVKGTFNSNATDFIFSFYLWSLPAMAGALYAIESDLVSDITDWLEIIMLLFSAAVIREVILPALQGRFFSGFAGTAHQTPSYSAAFALGLNLYFIFWGSKDSRFFFTRSTVYRIIRIFLIPIQFMGSIIPGGRGGALLAILYIVTTITILLVHAKRNFRRIRRLLLLFIIVALLSVVIWLLGSNEALKKGFNRAFEYLNPGLGISWQYTSGRDMAYTKALSLIKENPVTGYGLYGFWDVSGYPHNIFLEVLLQGGILYLVIFVYVLCLAIRKLFRIIKIDQRNLIYFFLSLYSMISLMFSGTYTTSPGFWFILVFLFVYKKPKDINNDAHVNKEQHTNNDSSEFEYVQNFNKMAAKNGER